MNRNYNGIVILGLGLMMGLYFTVDIISSRNVNAVANFTKVLTFGMLVLGCLRPQVAPYLIVLLGTFQNLLKRLAVSAGAFSMEDMIYTNAPSAALLAGAVVGVIIFRGLRNRMFEKKFWISMVLCTGLFAIMFAKAFMAKKGLGAALNSAVNGAAYVFMVPVIMTFFSDLQSCKKLLKWTALCFVFVALYALSQSIFGLNDLDYYYFQSAYTMVHIGEDATWFAMPGTLHNGVALSAAMLVMLFVAKGYHEGKFAGSSKCRSIFFTSWAFVLLLFVSALVIGGGRTQWAGVVLGIASVPFLTRKWAAVCGYLGVFVVYLVMVFSSEKLIYKMEAGELAVYKGENEQIQSAMVTSTLVDRLIGLNNMRTNPDLWTPFGTGTTRGLGEAYAEESLDASYQDAFLVRSDDYVHDMVSQLIIVMGYIPFTIFICVGLFILIKIVEQLQYAKRLPYGNMLLWLMAGVIGSLLTGLSSNKTLVQFPSNMLFWLVTSIVIVGVLQVRRDKQMGVYE